MFRKGPLAFLALPAGAAGGPVREALTSTLHDHQVEVVSTADLGTATDWKTELPKMLREADVVVADVSGADPNVLFEVGLAFGMSKPTLLLSQDKEVVNDIRAYQVARYRPDDVDSVRKYVAIWLREALVRS